jgi:hypothetical protein
MYELYTLVASLQSRHCGEAEAGMVSCSGIEVLGDIVVCAGRYGRDGMGSQVNWSDCPSTVQPLP